MVLAMEQGVGHIRSLRKLCAKVVAVDADALTGAAASQPAAGGRTARMQIPSPIHFQERLCEKWQAPRTERQVGCCCPTAPRTVAAGFWQ